ncbi:hypothetical protein F4804DRAFT_335785 [Jackrogersella minutella]|nr:hypothetical protein F4804DRAFT_335785 [Jackrogersella minutella]
MHSWTGRESQRAVSQCLAWMHNYEISSNQVQWDAIFRACQELNLGYQQTEVEIERPWVSRRYALFRQMPFDTQCQYIYNLDGWRRSLGYSDAPVMAYFLPGLSIFKHTIDQGEYWEPRDKNFFQWWSNREINPDNSDICQDRRMLERIMQHDLEMAQAQHVQARQSRSQDVRPSTQEGQSNNGTSSSSFQQILRPRRH